MNSSLTSLLYAAVSTSLAMFFNSSLRAYNSSVVNAFTAYSSTYVSERNLTAMTTTNGYNTRLE